MFEMHLQSNWKSQLIILGQRIGSKFSVLVVFDHWSTQMNIRDIRRVYPTIRLQTYPRRCELSLSKQSRMLIRFREFLIEQRFLLEHLDQLAFHGNRAYLDAQNESAKPTMTTSTDFWAVGYLVTQTLTSSLSRKTEVCVTTGSWKCSPERRSSDANVHELPSALTKLNKHETKGARMLGM